MATIMQSDGDGGEERGRVPFAWVIAMSCALIRTACDGGWVLWSAGAKHHVVYFWRPQQTPFQVTSVSLDTAG